MGVRAVILGLAGIRWGDGPPRRVKARGCEGRGGEGCATQCV